MSAFAVTEAAVVLTADERLAKSVILARNVII